jgi:hypothetical protein
LQRERLVDDLRHLDWMKRGIIKSESEYMATILLQEAKSLTQVIYSSVYKFITRRLTGIFIA